MATELEAAPLEQRSKTRAAADTNGHAPDVPDFGAVEDFALPDAPAGDSTDVGPEVTDQEDSSSANNKIYFIRVPRPPINDEAVKKLSAQFQEQVAKLKAMNAKLATKREELRELRRQMGVARSLKDGSQPEYEEKLNRLKELRLLRNGFTDKMKAIQETLRGLECKSEAELDAKVKELENKISHGSLVLREEKQVVGQISKLQAQRVQIRDYDNQKSSLTELEGEVGKVRTVITELESEFTILKAERDQAQGIIKEILTKVKACEEVVKGMEEEQAELVQAKNDVLASLEKSRNEMNDSMVDYRDNRSFSLKVRDMVTAGQVEEARALCLAQVDEYAAKLAGDYTFRKEYCSLWAAQRRYPISDLLPDSTTAVREPRADQGKGDAKKGGKGASRSAAPLAKPQGAEKAKALIEEMMAQASEEARRVVAGRPPVVNDEGSGDADDEQDVPAAVTVPVVEAIKPRAAAASARPADVLKLVELPKIEDVEFVPPVMSRSLPAEASSAAEDKEKLREEQARKAKEAEERKKKLAEQKEKKRKEGEVRRKQEEEQRRVEQAEATARAKQQAAERAAAAEEAARRKAEEAAARAAEAASSASSNPAHKIINNSQKTAAAKGKPKSSAKDPVGLIKTTLKKKSDLVPYIVVAVVILLCLILGILAMRSS